MGNPNYNFNIDSGATKVLSFEYSDYDNNGVGIGLYEMKMLIKDYNDNVVLDINTVQATDGGSEISYDGNGKFTLYITSTDTLKLTENVYQYFVVLYTIEDPYGVSDPKFIDMVLSGNIKTIIKVGEV